jgi:hypothetical protein
MAAALSSLGYIADRFSPAENRLLFRALVVACLESQLPVILLIMRKQVTGAGEIPTGHAVCVTGFSEPASAVDVPATRADRAPIRMKGGAVTVLYVHDDNLGSHAHYEIFDNPDDNDLHDGYKKLMLRRGRSHLPTPPASGQQSDEDIAPITPAPANWWNPDEWTIFGALVPKPDKLRLPVRQLLYDLIELRRLIEAIFPGFLFHYAPRFASGIEYKRGLIDLNLERSELGRFSHTPLPRHIGLLSTHFESVHLFDIVLDVSEVERDPNSPPVIAVVAPGIASQSPAWKVLSGVCARFHWALITAPVGTTPAAAAAAPTSTPALPHGAP